MALFGQVPSTDNQWIIKNGNGKNDFDLSTGNTFTTSLTNSKFSILGVSHPNLTSIPKAGNSVFVIHDKGTPFDKKDDIAYCTRRNLILMNGSYPNGKYTIDLSSTYKPTFLYFTNHYEGDDPPENVKVNNDDNNLLVYSLPQTKISLNHDIVRGKDVTLFINMQALKDYCGHANPMQINPINIKFDDVIFSPSNIFNGTEGYSYQDIVAGSYINTSGEIKNIPVVDYTNHFFNFVADPLTKYKPGDAVSFTISQGTCNYLVKDTIRDSHDPNFIKVACISKVGTQTFIKYHVECFNDGSDVTKASFTLTLPKTVDATTINISPWCHGTHRGCGGKKTTSSSLLVYSVDASTNEVKFTFPKGQLLAGNCPDIAKRTAWFDFCVKLKSGEDIHTCNLQPSNPYTTFGGHTNYAIEKFIDLADKSNENIKNKRKISPKCKCDCIIDPLD
jgi:hypothetical protein